MAFDAGTIVGKLVLKKDQWDQAVKKVKDDQKSLSGLVLKNSRQFKKMGRAMTIAGTAIVGAFSLMVKAHARFDQSMTESLAIMGDVSDEMKTAMAAAALEMSTKTVFAAEKLAASYFFLASAGMDAAQSIKALPVVAKFAQAGTFNLAVATDLLTDAQTALGLSSKDAVENQQNLIRVSDVLVGANTLANASVKQFAESLTNKAAAALVNVNKEVEEGVAVLAAYADKGVKGQLAGQRLTMMLNGLFAATMQNKKAWDEAGISLFNADESMRDMADIIQSLEGYLGDMTVKQREAALAALGFNLRTKDSILTLLGSSEKIRQWTKDLKGMQGITEEVSDKQLETFNNQLKLLRNTIVNAAISVGKTLTPAITKLVQGIKGTVEKVALWIKEHPKLTEIIAKSAIAVGALLTVLGPIAIMLPGIVTGVTLLGPAFTAMLGPVGFVVIAIAGLAVVIQTLASNLKEAKQAMSDFATEAEVFGNAAENFKKLWIIVRKEGGESLKQFDELMKRFGGNWEKIMGTIIRDPKFATLKALLLDIASGVKTIDKEGGKLSITLPASFLKVGKASGALTETLRKNSEEVIKLTTTMVDEIMRATLNEFEYRKWAAQATYDERKALLEREKADKEAFILLERAFAVELDGIEKDKTAKFKEGWRVRGWVVMLGLQAWYDAEKAARERIQMLHAGYVDIIKEFTLSEKNYRLWQLDEWYAAELLKLGANLEAKAALEKAYALQKGKIDEDAAAAQIGIIEKIGIASIMVLGQSKLGMIAQATMSTYAGAAKSLEMFGMPLAIPFIIASIITGFKQVQAIMAVDVPSAAEGGFMPKPAVIEAGHGPKGEVILPLDKAPGMAQRIVNQIWITVGEQTFYRESVKSVNKAGQLGDITIPQKVVV